MRNKDDKEEDLSGKSQIVRCVDGLNQLPLKNVSKLVPGRGEGGEGKEKEERKREMEGRRMGKRILYNNCSNSIFTRSCSTFFDFACMSVTRLSLTLAA